MRLSGGAAPWEGLRKLCVPDCPHLRRVGAHPCPRSCWCRSGPPPARACVRACTMCAVRAHARARSKCSPPANAARRRLPQVLMLLLLEPPCWHAASQPAHAARTSSCGWFCTCSVVAATPWNAPSSSSSSYCRQAMGRQCRLCVRCSRQEAGNAAASRLHTHLDVVAPEGLLAAHHAAHCCCAASSRVKPASPAGLFNPAPPWPAPRTTKRLRGVRTCQCGANACAELNWTSEDLDLWLDPMEPEEQMEPEGDVRSLIARLQEHAEVGWWPPNAWHRGRARARVPRHAQVLRWPLHMPTRAHNQLVEHCALRPHRPARHVLGSMRRRPWHARTHTRARRQAPAAAARCRLASCSRRRRR